VLATFTDHRGRIHEPPDPPEIEGYPPWFPRPREYRRTTPLARCPSSKCRRAGKCVSLLYGKYCQKTHMDQEAFRWRLCDRIDDIMRRLIGSEWDEFLAQPPAEQYPVPGPEWKKALNAASERLEKEALLKWQQKWVSEQQEKERQMLAARQARKTRGKGHKALVNRGISRP